MGMAGVLRIVFANAMFGGEEDLWCFARLAHTRRNVWRWDIWALSVVFVLAVQSNRLRHVRLVVCTKWGIACFSWLCPDDFCLIGHFCVAFNTTLFTFTKIGSSHKTGEVLWGRFDSCRFKATVYLGTNSERSTPLPFEIELRSHTDWNSPFRLSHHSTHLRNFKSTFTLLKAEPILRTISDHLHPFITGPVRRKDLLISLTSHCLQAPWPKTFCMTLPPVRS